jgi:tetratricopeptide (TPR) repeat protein
MNDRRGLPFSSGTTASHDAYEQALAALNVYRGDAVAIIEEALGADPDFVMGHVLRAEVLITMWERGVLPKVGESLERLRALHARSTDRERAHVQAVADWADGNWDGMRIRFERLLADHPRDLLALQVSHLADFYHGDRDSLRARPERALPAWTAADAGYGLLLGMHAFGLEECGQYAQAEDTGRRALDLQPDDCWAHHAVAHVMEMQARQAEGIAFMHSREAHWAQSDNAFAFHNWWHTALFHLDQGHDAQALALYDRSIRPEPIGVQLMMLDATALLWRLHLNGIDAGARWNELADSYERSGEAGFYVFNDLHAMAAYAASGREHAAAELLEAVQAAAAAPGTNARMTREAGLAVVQALHAFGQGRFADVVNLLLPVRYKAHAFGGSHAQRDIVHRTLIEAALRGGDRAMASALAQERTAQKAHCAFSRGLWQRAASNDRSAR